MLIAAHLKHCKDTNKPTVKVFGYSTATVTDWSYHPSSTQEVPLLLYQGRQIFRVEHDQDGNYVYKAAAVLISLEFCVEYAHANPTPESGCHSALRDFSAPMLETFHFSFAMMSKQL
jgi:hypothetical protein